MSAHSKIASGWKACHSGDHQRAEELFGLALKEAPTNSQVWIQAGLFHVKSGQIKKALEALTEAKNLDPDNPATHFFLCLAQTLCHQLPLAQQSLEGLQTVCPRHQGSASLELLITLNSGDPTSALQRLGFGQTRQEEAFSWRAMAAGIGVGDPAWLPADLTSSPYLLGPIVVEIEKRLLSLEIPQLERSDRKIQTELENLQPVKRNFREEFKGLKKSVKGSPYLRKGKGMLEKALGSPNLEEQHAELHRAQLLLRLARKLDPLAFRISFYLGEAYLFSAKSEPGEPYRRFPLKLAERAFVESARLDGVNPYIYFYLALTQHLLGHPEEALTLYSLATEKFAKLPEAYYGKGQCHLLCGEHKAAEEEFLKAIAGDLSLARERLNLFTSLLQEKGLDFLTKPLPELPPKPTLLEDQPSEASEQAPETSEQPVQEREVLEGENSLASDPLSLPE